MRMLKSVKGKGGDEVAQECDQNAGATLPWGYSYSDDPSCCCVTGTGTATVTARFLGIHVAIWGTPQLPLRLSPSR